MSAIVKSNAKSPSRRARVLISHQGCIPIYRKPLYERLSFITDVDYVVAYGEPPTGTHYLVAPPPYSISTLHIKNHEFSLAGTQLIWQPIVTSFWKDFDAAVIGDEAKYLSHVALILVAKLRRRPIVFWGFGYQGQDVVRDRRGIFRGVLATIGSILRKFLLSIVDGYLVYTTKGAEVLVREGFDPKQILVMRNTIDMEAQMRLRQEIAEETDIDCRRALGLGESEPVLLYFGRFLSSKRIDLAIDYIRRQLERGQSVSLLIFGEGPEKQRLEESARGLPITVRAHDDHDLARALRVANAVVIPGFVGLAITHCFAHDVPIITREGLHSPEIEYLKPGENGLILPPEPEMFFRGIDHYLLDPELQKKLRLGAARTANELSMDAMATRMDRFLRNLLCEKFPDLESKCEVPSMEPLGS
jgi:glycosyltransferase involved in cell wall biosynthesis